MEEMGGRRRKMMTVFYEQHRHLDDVTNTPAIA
jgi:hypothetical protein